MASRAYELKRTNIDLEGRVYDDPEGEDCWYEQAETIIKELEVVIADQGKIIQNLGERNRELEAAAAEVVSWDVGVFEGAEATEDLLQFIADLKALASIVQSG